MAKKVRADQPAHSASTINSPHTNFDCRFILTLCRSITGNLDHRPGPVPWICGGFAVQG